MEEIVREMNQVTPEQLQSSTLPTLKFSGPKFRTKLVVLPQKFEQRTIKFKIYATPIGSGEVIFVVKVPQLLFRLEPFSEVSGYHMDRLLRINRVPPTILTQLPLEWFEKLASFGSSVVMVHALQSGGEPTGYPEWIERDLVNFVKGKQSLFNGSHVFASMQLWIEAVEPLLGSLFKAPYSKQNPGWHRWMNPEYFLVPGNYRGSRSVQLALSELTIFDFITFNDDRSPNKNNFVVSACKKGGCRRFQVPTFIHLDQGMSYHSMSMEHNAIGKPKNQKKSTFCLFYSPLVHRIACSSWSTGDEWCRALFTTLPSPVRANIGEHMLRSSCGRIPQVLRYLERCLKLYNESVILQP